MAWNRIRRSERQNRNSWACQRFEDPSAHKLFVWMLNSPFFIFHFFADYLAGDLMVDDFVTHHRKLTDLFEGFNDMHVSKVAAVWDRLIECFGRLGIVSDALSTWPK
jgi:hypothetical protein